MPKEPTQPEKDWPDRPPVDWPVDIIGFPLKPWPPTKQQWEEWTKGQWQKWHNEKR